jgi:hypothetical protein
VSRASVAPRRPPWPGRLSSGVRLAVRALLVYGEAQRICAGDRGDRERIP